MKTTVSELTWGQNLDEFEAKYDVILGADIVYIRETFMDLIKTLKHLSDGKTVILMSSKLRYDRDTEFYQLMSESFSISEVHYDKIRDIHVYSAKKLSWYTVDSIYHGYTGLILGLRSANERWRYFVTTSLIGWAQT